MNRLTPSMMTNIVFYRHNMLVGSEYKPPDMGSVKVVLSRSQNILGIDKNPAGKL